MTAAPAPTLEAAPQSRQRIAAFTAQASFEVTRLAPGDLEALRGFPSCRRVYVSAVPARPPQPQIEVACALAAAGFEPVPHLAVRSFATSTALDSHLARLVEGAGVRRVLIIGGDLATPAGPFHAAIEMIDSGLLQARGIVEIGIAGYPDGHPRLTTDDLDRALAAKLEAAQQTGLGVHIVTQWAFRRPHHRLDQLAARSRHRPSRAHRPRRPGDAHGAHRYARICSVSASVQGLARDAGLARQLFGMITPTWWAARRRPPSSAMSRRISSRSAGSPRRPAGLRQRRPATSCSTAKDSPSSRLDRTLSFRGACLRARTRNPDGGASNSWIPGSACGGPGMTR
jgi:methylenetetrahydrofolate reductase (NADPH)